MIEDIKRIIGKHSYDGACAPSKISSAYETFSVGCFEWLKSSTRRPKRSKVKVRVTGDCSNAEGVYTRARAICSQLDAGTYKGRKTVRV